MFKLFSDENRFLITNIVNAKSFLPERSGYFNRLYGYYFGENEIFKDQSIDKNEIERLKSELGTTSGIFSLVVIENGNLKLVLDPLIQYNIFYAKIGDEISISNDFLLLSNFLGIKDFSQSYLFDQIAYHSPLRGGTMINGIYTLQYDDVNCLEGDFFYKTLLPLSSGNFSIEIPNLKGYDEANYRDLLDIYISRLNRRAEILSNKYKEVHVQLTGGADSRLVVSSMLNYDNTYCYCYGDGKSQNRLIFDEITSALNIKRSNNISFVGQNISNSALIIKGLIDSNFRKFNNLNTYVNYDDFVDPDKCKVTGYYGANISGGVGLPPADTAKSDRTKFLESSRYTYHSYVKEMRRRHGGHRRSGLNDLFYLNNRGPSHYASHSMADNKRANSYDILYDPININLVRSFPGDDNFISQNAISVDLIYENHKMLALFPYDNRKIPNYRKFKDIPLINCFNGFSFPSKDIDVINLKKFELNQEPYDLLGKGPSFASINKMLGYLEFDEIFEKFGFDRNFGTNNAILASTLTYYMMSVITLNESHKFFRH